MTGAEIAAARRRAGLSQAALGARVGVRRQAVSYWETKAQVRPQGHAPCLLLRELVALGALDAVPINATTNARARGGVLGHRMDWLLRMEARVLAEARARWAAREAAARARRRVPYGALTRKGMSCRALSEPSRRRCRFHGGRSTGPRTPEGRARIAEAQRRRWRAEREAEEAAAPRLPTAP